MNQYRGRFAPSPSGPLHFGSLVAALGSWLDARSHHGKWLVRMEDIDPPREVAGAADEILFTLENFGLHWDGEVSYQSANLAHYGEVVQQLLEVGLAYRCTCTRKQIQSSGGIYNNRCRDRQHPEDSKHSIRFKVLNPTTHFNDCFQGTSKVNNALAAEDFILQRKDGLFAYMLAVVVDDKEQQITHVIRGADLYETTFKHLSLFARLDSPPPIYGHLPMAVNAQGIKLSKQTHAKAINLHKDKDAITDMLWQALDFLKQSPPDALHYESKESLLLWATKHWDRQVFSGSQQFFYHDN